jgi:hypothetical protein
VRTRASKTFNTVPQAHARSNIDQSLEITMTDDDLKFAAAAVEAAR